MKVWGKEVNKCEDCEYAFINSYEDWECAKEPLKWGTSVDKYSIHKDCPFSKPITSEVIESYGFKLGFDRDEIIQYNWFHPNKKVYVLKLNRLTNIYEIVEERGLLEDLVYMYLGKINNPVELEFILKSLGIVE